MNRKKKTNTKKLKKTNKNKKQNETKTQKTTTTTKKKTKTKQKTKTKTKTKTKEVEGNMLLEFLRENYDLLWNRQISELLSAIDRFVGNVNQY